MLKIYFGNNPVAVRQAAFSYIDSEEAAGKEVVLIDADSYASGILVDAAGTSSLFGTESLYVLDTPSSQTDFRDDVEANLAVLRESQNQFVVIEGALLAAEKKLYAKQAKTVEEFKAEKADRFNTFAMADALARKDKKTLWLLLVEARAVGISDEEVIGILWWQLKTLQLATKTKTASEAGMKDFPYNKAKRSLSKFGDGEVERLSVALLTLHHQARAGEVELANALEGWALTL